MIKEVTNSAPASIFAMAEARRRTKESPTPMRRREAHNKEQEEEKKKKEEEPHTPSTKGALKSFFTCKHHHHQEHSKRIGCSGSICKLRDMERPEAAAVAPQGEPCKRRGPSNGEGAKNSSRKKQQQPLSELNGVVVSNSFSSHSSASVTAAAAAASSASSSSIGGSFRRMPLRRFSGCYECQMVVDPVSMLSRDSSLRATICSCPDCGEIFVKAESLEIHQAVRHAVSELGPEDTSRNIVEIIFQSSWLKKQTPLCKIDRILKVHNTTRTVTRFEDYRDSIKMKANKLPKRHPRCTADGNELLRFHCTTFMCSVGLEGATNLCTSIPHCNLCSIMKNGFKKDCQGRIQTMATSGRAHDVAGITPEQKSAMLVCRVVAGRVKRKQDEVEEYDSLAGSSGVYSNLDELFVFDPKAILPCFVVVYRS
ncbi:uncharacterized protein LOC122014416 [Zingiber officinale]|uniref:C2H2-type domain-containing protein n=1 Tax=Zingiber officinale TaxID=94328 RepID=A0A8J5FAS5_ZINOF|nr:uncharacterized protein LOC122014416 [Zingiber officinale]XP_042426580.1 uncharacterized protein LOC122014416 [Zingiber officinale]KAG6483133.1 hypothetical protein ZIOFF_059773 [Zingiber officinale]